MGSVGNMSKIITVGMADLKVATAPDILVTLGLGSCIGVCIWDPFTKIGGMAHIMLPIANAKDLSNKAKYADTAIGVLFNGVCKLGASPSKLQAKMAGGAQMFSFAGKPPILKIGDRNAEAVTEELKRLGIRLVASDVGGNAGRTIHYDLQTGALKVRTIRQGEKII